MRAGPRERREGGGGARGGGSGKHLAAAEFGHGILPETVGLFACGLGSHGRKMPGPAPRDKTIVAPNAGSGFAARALPSSGASVAGPNGEMSMTQRWCVLLMAALAALVGPAAMAQDFPSRQITILVGFPPGGAVDIVARALGERLSAQMGQPVIIENRPGANSNIAAAATAHGRADGYTLLVGANGLTTNMSLYAQPGYDVEQDLAPISSLGQIPNVIAAGPGFEGHTLADLIAAAKAKPGTIAYGSPGNGSSPHLTGELFERVAGIKLQHVPYRGGQPAITDALGGHIPLVMVNALEAMPHVKSGALTALAVTGLKRHPALPDVPTVAEAGFPGFDAYTWWALVAPAKTPPDIVARLNQETRKAIANPKFQERLEQVGGQVTGSTPAELAAFIKDDRAKWGRIIQEAGIKAE